MKKIVLTISDLNYEKLVFEAIEKKKSISEVIQERIFHTPFSDEVMEAYEKFLECQITNMMREKND